MWTEWTAWLRNELTRNIKWCSAAAHTLCLNSRRWVGRRQELEEIEVAGSINVDNVESSLQTVVDVEPNVV